ncbi:MAG: hypothetical protein A2V86_06605 [Deltaproteobacteria bacterium RBG_16_49_23]|nr:MAG: hypothetical protein A2V86_06605 [Deltaproteobacteria bacterium RBG_16_49_23]
MKKMLMILVTVLVLSLPSYAYAQFLDIGPNHWAKEYVDHISMEGITKGCAENLYCPDQPVTRAEMAAFLSRMLDKNFLLFDFGWDIPFEICFPLTKQIGKISRIFSFCVSINTIESGWFTEQDLLYSRQQKIKLIELLQSQQ